MRRGLLGRDRLIVALVAAFALLAGGRSPASADFYKGCKVDARDAVDPETGVVEHGPRRGNRVSLTFDERLGPYTRPILNALERRRARATFFTVGEQIRNHRRLVKRIVAQGHEHGNHTFSHPNLTELETSERLWELRATQRPLRRIGAFEPCLMRPPGGAVDSAVVQDAASLGLTTVKWDVAGGDAFGYRPREITERVLSQVRRGSIVLLHQTPTAAAALPDILAGLRKRGLRSVPVVKLLGGRFTSRSG